MTRRTIVITAVLVVLAASVTTLAAAMVVTDRGDQRAMMSRPGPDGQQPGWQRGERMPGGNMGPGRMGPGGMGMDMVGDEYGYLVEMIAHHEEAVSTARELQRSNRPEMRAFGEAIVATQSAQIEQMRSWLAQWYPDRPTTVDYQPMMRDLTELSGNQLDRAFLTDMIHHHMMAVMMSQQLLMRDVAEHSEVAELATAIRDEQHDEIFQMQRWLAEWFGDERGAMPHGRMGMMGMGSMGSRAT